MSYKIRLTQDDIKSLDFVGYRYDCGMLLLEQILINGNLTYDDKDQDDPDYAYGFTATIPEHTAWDMRDRIDNDTENRNTDHPLLGGLLWAKLTALYDSIV